MSRERTVRTFASAGGSASWLWLFADGRAGIDEPTIMRRRRRRRTGS